MDELVKTNSTMISSIAELAATNTQLTKEVEILSQEVNKYKKGDQEIKGGRGNPAKYFPNCNRDTWHEPYYCFEIENNAHTLHLR